ncbi:MAG: flagellar hook-basal body complex protein FliE [Candidatus Gastranaerophilales bacterium]|nr:flagellar hook-basal body complex protein FliE [Candidatus Gastranaerophilales bacterium]
MDKMFPKINLISSINDSKLNVNQEPVRFDEINSDDKIVSFSDTMVNMTKSLNNVANSPDTAMQDMLTGNGADIHDVMMAISKAEMSVTVATQITTKVVQAYEKIMAIQV